MTGVKSSSSTEFTASDGRRFAFPVGGAFLVLSGILWWRDHATPMWITAGLAAGLFVAGVTAPARLGPVYRGWMKLAHLISKVTTPIFMGVVYFLVFTVAGGLMRAFGKRPIEHEPTRGSYWRSPSGSVTKDMRRQF